MEYGNLLVILSVFVLLDILTGVVGAVANGNLDSAKMRAGLFHKAAFYCAFALAVALEYAACSLNLGVTVPAASAVVVYIVATEVVSILENICVINPELRNSKFFELFGQQEG